MTLCFVLCCFDFDVLTIEFSVLCTMLHILNGAIYNGEETRKERRENEYFNASVVMLVFI